MFKREPSYDSVTPFEDHNKNMCREVQRDPYTHLQSNWERQMSKQLPLRMFFNAAFMGFAGLYYLSRHNEINRIMRLKFSIDMIVNVGSRVALAGIVSDVATRKLFINYQAVTEDKVARNEVKKIMTTFPNAKTLLMPHEKPNSYYWA